MAEKITSDEDNGNSSDPTVPEISPTQNSPGFTLVQQVSPPEERYADGCLRVVSKGVVFKLDLYSVVDHDSESGQEVRSISQRIVLPVTAAPQIVNTLQHYLKNLEESGVLKHNPPTDLATTEDKGEITAPD